MKIKREQIKIKMKKHRRIRKSPKNRNVLKSLRLIGVNSAGLRSKLMTFKKVLDDLKPGVFFVEETKMKETGKLKFENYVVYEKVRKSRDGGGGIAIGCLKELYPAWVREGDEEIETLSVNIFVQNMKIRCCVAYGFQESELNDKKETFWKYLDEEVEEAAKDGSGLIIQFDGNLWAGSQIIPNDPRPQNRNGKFFENFLKRNPNLTVVNALDLCDGLITRSRIKSGKLEESVLDFFVVCDLIRPHITKMVIDEDGKYILTNYEQAKYGGKASNSDHATMYLDLDLKVVPDKPRRREIWNLKNKNAQTSFKMSTTKTKDFTDCFENNLTLKTQIENWRRVLNKHIKKSFKRIRINQKKDKPMPPRLSKLINERNQFVKKGANRSIIEGLDEEISKLEAETNYHKIKEIFGKYKRNPEKINPKEVWKAVEKLWPKCGALLPTAKINHFGKIVSEPKELKDLLAKEYQERLRTRPIRPDLKSFENRKIEIFDLKLRLAELKSSKIWSMANLNTALKDLKNNKTRDNDGFINEIFKNGAIGTNLKESLLKMFNKIREEKTIPSFMNTANITTIPKKGSKLKLENERGIFRLSVIRNIFMRLIYNDNYDIIDSNMSDCQMGARKKKGCRQNIFIINGIIHDVISSKAKKAIQLQIYDYKQMFDAINLKKAISDVYDTGLTNDSLSLLYQANSSVSMAVNTPSGLSDRQTIEDSVLQGDTFGSMLASVQVDCIAKEVEKAGCGYKYQDTLPISMLGLVDDLIGITAADHRALQMNTIMKVKTAEKQLQFGTNKCKTMIIGRNAREQELMGITSLTVDKWDVSHERGKSESTLIEKYAGEDIMEETKAYKYLGFVLSSKGDNFVNINEMRKKSIWIIRKIFTRLDGLHLKNYYFECGIMFLNMVLRSSILYASETYYNLTESQVRTLERIEEGYLRKLFQTSKGCPINQLYLESGHTPARFAIKKGRLLFLKTILEDKEKSTIQRFLMLQFENPSKGDWASSCMQDLKDLEINLSLKEIRDMSKYEFVKLIKNSIHKKAFEYLIRKKGSKGQEIEYTELKMAEYLTPGYENVTIKDQRNIFAMRNRMVAMKENFKNGKQAEKCACGLLENMKHVYTCTFLNKEHKTDIKYEEIFKENVQKQLKVSKIFFQKFEEKEKYKIAIEQTDTPHVIQLCDPLSLLSESTVMDCK